MYNARFHNAWMAIGCLMLATILTLSLLPVSSEGPKLLGFDKVLHAGAFLTLFCWFGGLVPVPRYKVLFAALLAFGALIEFAQFFTADRSMELADWVADAVGLGVGWFLSAKGLNNWPRWIETRVLAVGSGAE